MIESHSFPPPVGLAARAYVGTVAFLGMAIEVESTVAFMLSCVVLPPPTPMQMAAEL